MSVIFDSMALRYVHRGTLGALSFSILGLPAEGDLGEDGTKIDAHNAARLTGA